MCRRAAARRRRRGQQYKNILIYSISSPRGVMDITFIYYEDDIQGVPEYGKLITGGILDNTVGLDNLVKLELRNAINLYRAKHGIPELYSLRVGILGTTEHWSSAAEVGIFDIYINCQGVSEKHHFFHKGEKMFFCQNEESHDEWFIGGREFDVGGAEEGKRS